MFRDKRKEEEDKELSSPAWMVTYGDMMTLILCFFVLLFSFSSVDTARFQEVMEALQARMGILDGGRTFTPAPVIDSGLHSELYSRNHYDTHEFRGIILELEKYISAEHLESEISVSEDERGLTIRMTGKVLYDIGKADLKPAGIDALTKIASFLENINNDINVEGHTDNWPISNEEFPNNWVLSTVRATNVIQFFEQSTKISPQRLSASGYAEHRPLVPNDTIENRALNRRVDIVVLRTVLYEEAEGVEYNE